MKKDFTNFQKTVNILLLAAIFFAPLKMGTMLLPGMPQTYPDSIFNLLINSMPPAFFPVLSGILLILSVLAYGIPQTLTPKSATGKLLLMWLFMPLAALLGFIDADSLESPVVELEYILGLSAFVLTTAIVLNSAGEVFRKQMFNAAAAGTVFTCLSGVYQYFFGFNELKEFIETQEKLYNIEFPEALKARAYDVRTYATFTFASAFAAMLILSGALTVVRASCWGKHFEPVQLSQKLFGVLTAALCIGMLLTTKGRGAFLAALIALGLSVLLMLKNRKLQIAALTAVALAIIAGACYIHYAGRGFSSMTERVGYLKSSAEMLIAHPFCGDGWGDFTFHHALNKSFGNEELAKDPHNIVAAFAGQTGIAGGLLILSMLIFTVFTAYSKYLKERSWENIALAGGLCAFSLHILMDLDWQVPGLMIFYAVLSFAAVYTPEENISLPRKNVFYVVPVLLTAILSLLGGIHWGMVDSRHSALLSASGQEIGVISQQRSSYEVDMLAKDALKLAPYSHSIYHAWANDKMHRGDYDRAAELCENALKKVPRSHIVTLTMAEIYKKSGQLEKARIYQEKADKLFPLKKELSSQ